MADGQPAEWALQDGTLVCRTGSGDLFSRVKFRNAQIRLEFNVPSMPDQSGQARGNSGVMLHDRTNEIQILDLFQNPTYADGVCGALYGVAPPQVNAYRRPGEWQTYEIIFHAPHCGMGGRLRCPAALRCCAMVCWFEFMCRMRPAPVVWRKARSYCRTTTALAANDCRRGGNESSDHTDALPQHLAPAPRELNPASRSGSNASAAVGQATLR